MIITHILKSSLISLKTNKMRSALTILGIVIGVLSIILIMSLGQGAQNLILGQINSIGAKIVGVVPGRQPKSALDMLGTIGADSLKQKDLDALLKKSNAPHIKNIMPVVFGSAVASYGNTTYRTTVLGVNEMFASIYDIYPDQGTIFTPEDVRGYTDTVIIGSKIKDELFGASDALGQKIKLKNKSLRVIGILPHKGASSFFNFDEAALLPYTTAQNYIFGIKYFNRLAVEVDDEKNVDSTVEDINITLRNSHNITDPDKDDFFVETSAQALDTVGSITSILTIFLSSIAGISLLVGGIGIMNIMLVSVTERTKEIGLRKALGATEQDILYQFVIESVILTLTGGLIGTFSGVFLSFLISLVLSKALALSWTFTLPISAIILGVGVSIVIGLVFGYYPARQAARKEPIEALKHE